MNKPTPVSEILRRIQPLAPFHQHCHLRGLIASETRHGMRRVELEEALKNLLQKEQA